MHFGKSCCSLPIFHQIFLSAAWVILLTQVILSTRCDTDQINHLDFMTNRMFKLYKVIWYWKTGLENDSFRSHCNSNVLQASFGKCSQARTSYLPKIINRNSHAEQFIVIGQADQTECRLSPWQPSCYLLLFLKVGNEGPHRQLPKAGKGWTTFISDTHP